MVTEDTRDMVRQYLKETSRGKETFTVDPKEGAKCLGISREQFLGAIVDILRSGESVAIMSQQALTVTLTPAFGWNPSNPVAASSEKQPLGVSGG
jgi:hypothetical protein